MAKTFRVEYCPRYPEVHQKLEATRFCVLVAHRRFGKTVLAVNHLIKMAWLCQKTQPRFAYIAPFRNQAKVVAWDYLKRYTKNCAGRKINESELSVTIPGPDGGAKIRIFGADNPDALRGQYFDGVVLDEVAQMKSDVWDEIIQPALADRCGWTLFIGTPKGINLFSSLYYQALERQGKGDPDWAAFSFDCYHTAALPAERIEEMKAGMSEAKFRQEMLCDFAASTDDTLIPLDVAMAAMDRNPDPKLAAQWPLVIGVDVARFGDDATVFFGRRGRMAYEPVVLTQLSNVEVAHRLVNFIHEQKPRAVCIDQGQGTGVIDLARGLLGDSSVQVVEVPFGSRARNSEKYFNRRAEMWTEMRDWLVDGGSIPKNTQLLAELTAPTYSYDGPGRIRLEAKEKIKERLCGKSTDLGDALALTFAIPVLPLETERFRMEQKTQKPFDPFAGKLRGKWLHS